MEISVTKVLFKYQGAHLWWIRDLERLGIKNKVSGNYPIYMRTSVKVTQWTAFSVFTLLIILSSFGTTWKKRLRLGKRDLHRNKLRLLTMIHN